jgi:hypothetical protein
MKGENEPREIVLRRNDLGIFSRRLSIGAGTLSIGIFATIAIIEVARATYLVGVTAAGLGACLALYALFGFVRLSGDPQLFEVSDSGLVLEYRYPTFRRTLRLSWSDIDFKIEELKEGRVRLTTFQRKRLPRRATLEIPAADVRAVRSFLPVSSRT